MTSPVWTQDDLSNPHTVADKADRVKAMFGAIAPSYDLNNRVHSLGLDRSWRRAAVKAAGVRDGDMVVDVACGTGDLSLAFAGAGAGRVVGVDFTYPMVAIAKEKAEGIEGNGKGCRVGFAGGDAMRLPVRDGVADVVSIAFGIRNVADPGAGMREFWRVLKPGGRLVILEFGIPGNRGLRGLYNFYFRRVMPRTAGLIAGDRSGAYKYLPRSVETFIDRGAMIKLMEGCGFGKVTSRVLSLGIAVVYRGVKK